MKTKLTEEVSIVLCGAAGLGIQTVEELLTKVLKKSGYHFFATKEYMSRVRGGLNSTEIRVSKKPVKAFVERIDLFFVFSPGAVSRHKHRLSKNTLIIGEHENIMLDLGKYDSDMFEIPITEEAQKLGNKVYSNSIAVGIITGLLDIELTLLDELLSQRFAMKGSEVITKNSEAVRIGYKYAKDLEESGRLIIDIQPTNQPTDRVLLGGTEAVAIGALAGGCNNVYAYPMSPSTGVWTFLSQHQKEFDLIVEQVEDEIAAVNAVIGSWFVGGRGMVTTAGGGFALMEEGISLAGITETPIVIHLAQRPGPATGLPTRTAQEDLNLALYSGHGEFPRIIFAPGTIEDAFYLTQKAFNLADKYQIPVFILTDQYLLNSFYDMPQLDIQSLKIESHTIETNENYKRYELTASGISPRGIPGGKGLVAVDSHEHDEEGHITEDLEFMRKKMVEKRFKKKESFIKETLPPEFIGDNDFTYLIISWGSTYHIIAEALKRIKNKQIAFLHFKQIFPLSQKTKDYLTQAKKIIVIENNFTSQFSVLLASTFGMKHSESILKYTGIPFSVEEIQERILQLLGVDSVEKQ